MKRKLSKTLTHPYDNLWKLFGIKYENLDRPQLLLFFDIIIDGFNVALPAVGMFNS